VVVGKWRASTSPTDTNPPTNTGGQGATTGKAVGGRTREATFVQKIDNPLSPIKQGRGFWVQRTGWTHSGAFIVETFSVLKDVPFSDSWAIRNKWLVRPLGALGMDSPMCQVTVSIEAHFFKKLLWSAKMESETLAQAAKDYDQLVPKVISYVQADDVGSVRSVSMSALPPAVQPRRTPSVGETEVEMLRRRLAECEQLLRTGAAVRVPAGAGGGPQWLKGALSAGKKSSVERVEFIVRAEFDAKDGSWAWQADGTPTVAASAKSAKAVVVWPANLAAPSA